MGRLALEFALISLLLKVASTALKGVLGASIPALSALAFLLAVLVAGSRHGDRNGWSALTHPWRYAVAVAVTSVLLDLAFTGLDLVRQALPEGVPVSWYLAAWAMSFPLKVLGARLVLPWAVTSRIRFA